MNPEEFIRANTVLTAPPLVPQIQLHLASEVLPLWHATEDELAKTGTPPPYWAFAWAGGQALARHILDHPELVRGKRVLDIGAGSGLVGLAAAKAGAASVGCADIDGHACAAMRLNADANNCALTITDTDLIGTDVRWDILLVGDLFYERPLAERLLAWLRPVADDTIVLLGDPGRSYFPKTGVEQLAVYDVPTTRDLEDREMRTTAVYRLLKAG